MGKTRQLPDVDLWAKRYTEKMGGEAALKDFNEALASLQEYGTKTGCPSGFNTLEWARIKSQEARKYAHNIGIDDLGDPSGD